ncbi:MAG: FtsW/RodA/SpoVE family cell cycle protein [Roseburia sp.]|nr:FtsW/RodA/SpoVE family cell cycle protein [Roseburia sp.]
MLNLIIEVSQYLIIILFGMYTLQCFVSQIPGLRENTRNGIYHWQRLLIYIIHMIASNLIYIVTDDLRMVILYVAQFALITVIQCFFQFFYEKASRLLTNNMCMLLIIGFVMITRISPDKAIKQTVIAALASMIAFIVPLCIRRVGIVRNLYPVFAAGGLACLLAVYIVGAISYGAKLSISIGGVSFQPAEFVKISFIFFVAGMLYKNTSFLRVCITTALAAAHVLILVISKDLGAALIFFVVYLVMLFVSTKNVLYIFAGTGAGAAACVAGYHLFSHVRVRFLAWQTPLEVIDNEGYQICQSLFAIGTGSWMGLGLYKGEPEKIPVVAQDFIFSAISEEFGGIFAVCLILVCLSCFLLFLKISMEISDQFHRLLALGLGSLYGFQVFLTIGGVTNFIPSTGVTLPLVSYGGSSILSSIIIFAIIQGVYILKQDEGRSDEKRRVRKKVKKTEKISE